MAYVTNFKGEVIRIAYKFEIKGKALQEMVCKKLHFYVSLSTLNGILKRKEDYMIIPYL